VAVAHGVTLHVVEHAREGTRERGLEWRRDRPDLEDLIALGEYIVPDAARSPRHFRHAFGARVVAEVVNPTAAAVALTAALQAGERDLVADRDLDLDILADRCDDPRVLVPADERVRERVDPGEGPLLPRAERGRADANEDLVWFGRRDGQLLHADLLRPGDHGARHGRGRRLRAGHRHARTACGARETRASAPCIASTNERVAASGSCV